MKLTIKQHTDNLRNSRQYLEREEARLKQLSESVAKHRERVEFADKQLRTAIQEGRDSYDPERFLRQSRTGSDT